jgi:hypothetical protein
MLADTRDVILVIVGIESILILTAIIVLDIIIYVKVMRFLKRVKTVLARLEAASPLLEILNVIETIGGVIRAIMGVFHRNPKEPAEEP